jgi:DNA-directed RNA polymerase subunit RPC12/RpoP
MNLKCIIKNIETGYTDYFCPNCENWYGTERNDLLGKVVPVGVYKCDNCSTNFEIHKPDCIETETIKS